MITDKNYEGARMTLIDAKTGRALRAGEYVKTFRDEVVTLKGGRAPHKEASTGRVYVLDTNGNETEFFPSVIGAEWRVF